MQRHTHLATGKPTNARTLFSLAQYTNGDSLCVLHRIKYPAALSTSPWIHDPSRRVQASVPMPHGKGSSRHISACSSYVSARNSCNRGRRTAK